MYVFIYNFVISLQWMMGMGEKTPKYVQYEKQGKILRLVALPSPRLRKWGPTVFRCPKTPKTSRTYPRLDWDPTLEG